MSDAPVPPPNQQQTVPPQIAPPPFQPPPPQAPKKPSGPLQRAWAAFVAVLITVGKWLYPVFKLAKGSKLLLTAGSMFISMWFYATRFGWALAAIFVVCILIHEMGHVFVAWRLGERVSAPIFIPFFGALILMKQTPRTAWDNALIGYGGPLFGAVAGIGCWAIYGVTGHPIFLVGALLGFMINLFNMIPLYPMDGGRITSAVSPYIWIVGLVIMVAMTLTGFMRNPLIWILIIMSLPNLISGFRRGTMDQPGFRTTGQQKTTMGLAYVALCGFLAWGMSQTSQGLQEFRGLRRPRQYRPSVPQNQNPVVERKACSPGTYEICET